MPPKKELHRGVGIGLLSVGAVLLLINWISMSTAMVWFPKILLGGIVLVFLGLAMTIFPAYDANGFDKDYFSQIFKNTPVFHLIMWGVSLVLSVLAMIWVFDHFNLSIV